MGLTPGTRLGPYQILSALGAGGMGEVYRARDPRLGRDVAVKVLPAAFSADPERLTRFEKEARAAAALNHPNILAVHDIGQHDGAPYTVSELLEGETLRERLSGGALPVRKAVEHAIQIAHGLAAAHEKGITHRDLKPENVFVTSDGRVKILDFGLAKLTQAEPAGAALSTLPTTPQDTLPGVVLGTVGYMAPEQVRGLAADHRSDIFAFGATLYEMLSGQRAFRGETTADTMTAILKEDPPDLPVTDRHIPPTLERIVDHCLAKNPTARFQSAEDLAFALDALSSQSGRSEMSAAIAAAPKRLSRERIAWSVAALLIVVSVALGARACFQRTPVDPHVYRATLIPPADANMVVRDMLPPRRLAVSPDGRRLAFIAAGPDGRRQLWVRPLDGLGAQPLAGTENAFTPFWSPDSRWIGFFADGRLKKIEAAGGPPLTLCEWRGPGGGGTWNRDGVILFADDVSPFAIRRVSASGGAPSIVRTPDRKGGETEYAWPFFLPDGQHFIYRARGSDSGVYLGSLDSNDRKLLLRSDSNAKYAQGYLIFLRQTTLMAQPFDVGRLELVSDAVPIAEQVNIAGTETGAFTVSDTGVLVYQAGSRANLSQLVWFDRVGKQVSTLGDRASYGGVELSPDGTRAIASILDSARGTWDLWMYDVARGLRTRFTFDPGNEDKAVWSPDGSRIVFNSTKKGRLDLYVKPSSTTGNEELLLEENGFVSPTSWSPDGRSLLYSNAAISSSPTGSDVRLLPLSGDRKPFVFLQTPFNEEGAAFSPDGRWIAYQSDESGRYEIYVTPFPKANGKWQISTAGGSSSRWRRDGKEIFYLAPDNKLMAVAVNGRSAAFGVAAVRVLFETLPEPGVGDTSFDVAADGQRFLVKKVTEDAVSQAITLIVNWPELVKK